MNCIHKSWVFESKKSAQCICASHPTTTEKIDFVVGHIELDSNTDITVTVKNGTVLDYNDQKCNIAPYYDEYER